MNIIDKIRQFLEIRVFGVCTQLGEKMRIPSGYIRMFFIYATFVANGSPIIIYLILAFWVNMKNFIVEGHRKIWNL